MGDYTAADIITFIGVPLAVLGVMPLLWNMVKAFVIRRHLVKALPPSIRHHFSIIMDPAAGTVSLALPSLFLDAGSLIGYDVVSPDNDIELAESLSPGDWKYEGDRGASDSPSRKLRVSKLWLFGAGVCTGLKYKGEGPAGSWMDLPSVGVKPNREHGAVPVRVTVESDLNCPPTLLSCKWPTFLSLAMGLGFYPLDKTGRCQDAVDRLRDALRHQTKIATPLALRDLRGEVLLQASPASAGNIARLQVNFQYSLNRVLAWHNVMLVPSGEDSLTCVALPSLETFSLTDILAFSTEGIVRWRQGTSGDKVLSAQPFEPYRLDIHTTEWRPETFEHCLTWTLYTEIVEYYDVYPLPTSQTFLIWQDMSLVWLGRRERMALYQQLAELIKNPDLLSSTKVYLEECWNTPIFSTGTVAPQLSPYQGLLEITPLTSPATFRARLEQKGGGSYAGALRNSIRLGSKYDSDFRHTRPRLWTYLESHDVCRIIMARYNPDLGARTRTDDVLVPGSLEELAAHLLIATALFKAWPRADWFLHWSDVDDDGRVHYRTYDDNPMRSVLKGESSTEDLATMGVMYLA
ncbi:hypothetical protein B0T18DRAFT_391320 [Schizothecium vesticola]|uniref:Uncharacterized protein n=1 Tax=Schizothecium vesticola TaxID=314040 RepID=A0AA40K5R4_9PEZI|nr:hypothetical protein B0T18DRAFT_391320 [Schizothecium vesticola]